MKKRNIMIGSAVVLAVLLVVGTMAWFTDSEEVTNTFTAGTVDIELHDKDVEGDDFVDKVNVNPGDEYDKMVYVENIGSKCAYVRVKLTPEFENLNEEYEDELPEDIFSVVEWGVENGDGELVISDEWIRGEEDEEDDGIWYYYEDCICPGEDAETTNLIEKIRFKGSEMTNAYQGATFRLKVEADAVQASHEAYEDVWTDMPDDVVLNPCTPPDGGEMPAR